AGREMDIAVLEVDRRAGEDAAAFGFGPERGRTDFVDEGHWVLEKSALAPLPPASRLTRPLGPARPRLAGSPRPRRLVVPGEDQPDFLLDRDHGRIDRIGALGLHIDRRV